MTRQSDFVKLLLANLALIGVVVLVGGLISHRSLTHRFRQAQRAEQIRTADLAHAFVRELWPELARDRVASDRYCKESLPARATDARLTIIAADGVVLGDSSPVSAADMVNHLTLDRPEIGGALRGRPSWHVRTSETLNESFRYYAKPIVIDGQVAAVVRVAMPTKVLSESAEFIWRSLLIGAGVAVAAAVLVGSWISWARYVPLRQVMREAQSIATGDGQHTLQLRGSKELVSIAGALDAIRGSIDRQAELIDTQRANLAAVLRNLPEGIVATDPDDHVVLINPAALAMLEQSDSDVLGRHVQSVIRILGIIDLYDSVKGTARPAGKRLRTETPSGLRTVDVRVSPVRYSQQSAGQLLVLRDVTEQAQVEAMKAEFVANTSHELRTPLATLRAAVESLAAAESDDDVRKLTAMLERHLKHLEDLTTDLLSLHSVEDRQRLAAPQEIQLAALADWAHSHYAARAAKRDLAFDVEAQPSDAVVTSDRMLLEVILQNLLDNAMKFTPPGGRVTCSLQSGGHELTLTVADTGCGIPPEDQQRVFERFFQVDRAKSGAAGQRGTGLGLSIVKHAAQQLGAEVLLDSKPNVGTTVTVRIHLAATGG